MSVPYYSKLDAMKRIASLMFALATLMTLCANPVSRNAARQTANLFAQKKGAHLAGEPRMAPGRLASAERQPLYVFNMADDGGFVIVAGDDKAVPVLGYATTGSYDEALLPDNFRLWLEQMAGEIEAIGDDGEDKEEADGQDPTPEQKPEGMRPKIDPLIQTHWSQGSAREGGYIYNMLCPEIDGRRTLTGCVATAGAQIMYYYQHPKDSIAGIPGYVLDGATVNTSEPLDSAIFKWDLMKQDYTAADNGTESAKAVAELMLYCGYAANMRYGLGGSSSNERTLAQNMTTYFDYDPYTWKYLSRSMFSVSAWEDLIYGELAEGRPVIYSGNGNKGGHGFLCDGYDGEGLYHFNWGWGGYLDGYFALYATNPYDDITDYGYIFDQTAIIGLQPSTGVVPEVEPIYDEPDEAAVIEGTVATALPDYTQVDGTYLQVYFFNMTGEVRSFDFGLAELSGDGSIKVLVSTGYNGSRDIAHGSGLGFRFNVSSLALSEGSHTLIPVSRLKGEDEWRRCQPAEAFYTVTVGADDSIDIVKHPCKQIVVSDFEVTSPCLPYQKQSAKVSITNEGDFYDSNLQVILCSEEGAPQTLFFNLDGGIHFSTLVQIKIRSGNTKHYELSLYENGSVFAPGSYVLKLYEPSSKTELASTSLVIGRNLEVTGFAVNGNRLKESIQEVDVTVKNLAGDYTAPLYLFASRTEEKGESVYAAGIGVESGDSTMLRFYFRPELAGQWNLWVTLDEKGDEVVCHNVVTIVRDPEEVAKAVDVDHDGEVTLKDVTALTNLIGSMPGPDYLERADINGDGQADICDILTIIKAMTPEEPAEEPTEEPAEEPTDEPTDEPAEEPTDEPAE